MQSAEQLNAQEATPPRHARTHFIGAQTRQQVEVGLLPAPDECGRLDWVNTSTRTGMGENDFVGFSNLSRAQRVLMPSPTVYYSNESAGEKGNMKLPEQNAHAAECMRSTAAPGALVPTHLRICHFRLVSRTLRSSAGLRMEVIATAARSEPTTCIHKV